ncbi:MAG: hypothetical protein JO293_06120 [Candidatus Eremiobacteraeota bacterium]|nr:hypothetical protein [Candidatus Eremiobacteraeota bacterium]MBV8222919.1 hypothetical protein [Candidatus Eremiobacteraeota bacterium]
MPGAIDGGGTGDPFRVIDMLGFGYRPRTIEGALPFAQAHANLAALAAPRVVQLDTPSLIVSLRGSDVQAAYEIQQREYQGSDALTLMSLMLLVRPVFRGTVMEAPDGSAVIRGAFGLNWTARVLGIAALVVALALATAAALHEPIGFGVVAWVVVFGFLLVAALTRFHSEDDDRLILRNLEHALNDLD